MPLPLADAKAMARARLRGKNAKPDDVNRMAQKLVQLSYEQGAGGSYDYATATGQSMQHKGRGGGDSVEYQTGGNLSNYIDRVLEMGGLNAPAREKTVQPTDGEVTTPETAPVPSDRPVEPDKTKGPDKQPTKDEAPLGKVLAGTMGIAALYALYRIARRRGVKPEQLTDVEAQDAIDSTRGAGETASAPAELEQERNPLNEAIDEQLQERPVVETERAPANENQPTADVDNERLNQHYHEITKRAAEFRDPGERMRYLKAQGLNDEQLAQVLGDIRDVLVGGGFDFTIRRPKIEF